MEAIFSDFSVPEELGQLLLGSGKEVGSPVGKTLASACTLVCRYLITQWTIYDLSGNLLSKP